MNTKLLPSYDMGSTFGLPSVVVQGAPAYVCPECGDVLLLGPVIDALRNLLRHQMLVQNFALGGSEIRFLRKSVAMTQQRMGALLGVDRVTIARWESQDAQPVGIPESIAIRTIIRAVVGEPEERASLMEPPIPRPSHFELRAPKFDMHAV